MSRYEDIRVRKLAQRLEKVYAQAQWELTEKVDSFFADFDRLDKEKRAQVEAGKLSEAGYKDWKTKKLLMGEKYKDLRDTMAERLLNANQIAARYINGELPEVYAHNYNQVGKQAEDKIDGFSFDIVDENTVRRLSTKNETLLPYKVVDGRRDVRWNTKKVNSAILQGILQGESAKQMAKRLQGVTEMNKASAMRNARTAVTGAQNKGRFDAMQKLSDDGVIMKKEWIASSDPVRTRDAHKELNRVQVDVDKPFENSLGRIMYPGDPNAAPANVYNCRCTLAEVFVGFKPKENAQIQPEKTEAERKMEEYQELKKRKADLEAERDSLNAQSEYSADAWKAQMRLEKLKDALEHSSRYERYAQYETEEEFKSVRRNMENEIKDIYDELEKMRETRPRARDYSDGQEDQWEKDFGDWQKRRDELQEKVQELEKRLYYQTTSWKDIELYREAKALGLPEIEKQLNEMKAQKERKHERQAEISKEISQIGSQISSKYLVQRTVEEMQDKKVAYREPTRHKISDLINPLAGGDLTEGSCASLAMCYTARKHGIDMLDFRDGDSREVISMKSKSLTKYFVEKHGAGATETAKSWTTAGHRALSHCEVGKEYYFSCARHAAIVRKREDGWVEYLELQSGRENGNGWFALGNNNALIDDTLCWRFGASRNGQGYEYSAALVDIDALGKDSEFQSLLGYINTAEDAQRKGIEGHER